MKKLCISNSIVLLICFVFFSMVYFPLKALDFRAFNKYITIPSSEENVMYVLPGEWVYTMKYVTHPTMDDTAIAFYVNSKTIPNIKTIVRGEHKTFKSDIHGKYFISGKNQIEFRKKMFEPDGYVNKFTLRNFKKNIFDLDMYIVYSSVLSYGKLLRKGCTVKNGMMLILYFALLVLLSAGIVDYTLLRVTYISSTVLQKLDIVINSIFILITIALLLSIHISPYTVILVPLYKYFSVYVCMQSLKFVFISFMYFKGSWGMRFFTVFIGLFVTFVLFMITDMVSWARFCANIAYVFFAISVIIIAIERKREGSFAQK